MNTAGLLKGPPSPLPPPASPPEEALVRAFDTWQQRPSKVLLHNDDFTPVEVVIRVLVQEFSLSSVRATWLTWKAHFAGNAVVGTWPRAEAELRVDRAHAVARAQGWPLRLSVEDA